jgi:fluoride exporter
MESLSKYLWIAAGSALGGMLRYYLNNSSLSTLMLPFPTATFFINITGSFIIGFFITIASNYTSIGPNIRLAIAVGFVGSYTTFSTFEYETFQLVSTKHLLIAGLYVSLSLLLGFIAVWTGILVARKFI